MGLCFIGALLSCTVVAWHGMHYLMVYSTFLSIFGNQTVYLSSCLVLTTPWCPSWARLITWSWRFLGIIIWRPLKIIRWSSLSVSSLKICVNYDREELSSIRPFLNASFRSCSSSSWSVASLISSSRSAVTSLSYITLFTYFSVKLGLISCDRWVAGCLDA